MAERNGVLIVGEAGADGLRPASLELITAAKKIGGPVTGLLFGCDLAGAAAKFGSAGLDRLLVADSPALATASAEAATSVIAEAIAKAEPAAVLMLNTTLATEYAPSLSARLNAPLVTDAFDLKTENGTVIATRPAVGGRLQTDVTLAADRVQLISVRAGAFEKATVGTTGPEVDLIAAPHEPLDERVQFVAISEQETSGIGLEAAEIVVAGGRGLKDAASFALIEQLAAALGGAVGATRAVTDLGWRPHSEQIGQTGKTIAPKLYIAAGISGAVQHTVGMTGSENIVAINRDPDAPIFKVASFGIVGDIFEVLPALTVAISAARS
jgi:electron transfer flavoprotein alpha subunit